MVGCDQPFNVHTMDVIIPDESNRPKVPPPPGLDKLIAQGIAKAIEAYIPDTDWLFEAIKGGVKEAFVEAFESQPLETYRSAGHLIADAIADGTREAMKRE